MLRTPLLRSAALIALLLVASACDAGPPPAPETEAEQRVLAAVATPELRFRASVPFHAPLPDGYRIEAVASGLVSPAAIDATPDGRLLIAEQTTGRVRVVRDGVLLAEPWVTVPVSYDEESFLNELGLVGLQVDPLFAQNGLVYLYYTTADGDDTRRTLLTRFHEVNGRGVEPRVLLEIDRETERTHVAGGMTFAGDALYVGVGDHEIGDLAQEPGELPGKILRIDRNGEALPDNPFFRVDGYDPRVYAYGVRNPFGLTANPATGQVYFTDNRDAAGDAVYELRAGEDYGWPYERLALVEPIVVYEQPMGLAGAAYYDRDVMPELKDSLLFCSFHFGGMLHWSDLTPGLRNLDLVRRDQLLASGCTSSLTVGADGFVYFLSIGTGQLLRISRDLPRGGVS